VEYGTEFGTREVTLVDHDLLQPNGIALSPDHATLYVGDTEGNVVMAYPVAEDGTTGEGAWFADISAPNGLAVDVNGNVYVAGSAGVVALRHDGVAWGTIALPEAPTNVAFGGSNRRTLYVTAPTAVYGVRLGVPGLPASF
jgi:gluconolactonase